MPSSLVKIAAVQAAPVAFDLINTIKKLETLVAEAKSGGARLVVLPEAFLSAYPRHLDFQVGSRTGESREWYGRYVKSSVKIPDGCEGKDWLSGSTPQEEQDEFWAFERLCQIAQRYQVFLSIGIIECSLIGSTLWCTNLLLSPTGILLSKHRKLQPTAAERVVWSQGEGNNSSSRREVDQVITDNLPVVSTEIGRIGGLICWENFMPLARYLLYKKGVEIYTAPTADGRTTWMPSMQHIAQEGRCFVVSANQYHTSADFPADYPVNLATTRADGNINGSVSAKTTEAEVWCRGGSCIISPLGEVLAGPLWDEEGIVYADLDLDSLHGAKLDFDPVGHYSRNELMMDLLTRP